MFPSSPIPRPEYPRPDRQRGTIEGIDWLNLNGSWQFRFDHHRIGFSEEWFLDRGPPWRRQIIVPFCWESLAAWGNSDSANNENYYSTNVFINPLDVTRDNHRNAERFEVGWYRKVIQIPDTEIWHGRRVILTIGAADFYTDCWCNGVHLGHHEGGYLPFEFDLTNAIHKSADGSWEDPVIVIRVEDPMDHHEQPVGKQWGWYTTTSGIWQTVYVEPRSLNYIESFRMIPDIDEGTVRFEITVEGENDTAEVAVEISSPSGAVQNRRFTCHGKLIEGNADIYPILLWDPDSPNLYDVVFSLTDHHKTVQDTVRGYFGMRKIATGWMSDPDAPAMLCLNNSPIYLRGALYQSYYPEGVYTARYASTLKEDIIFAKSAGFDFLRIHIKLDDPLLLYYADKIGMLLMQDFPNFGEGGDTPLGRKRFEEMMLGGIKRDFNHPSIISWCIFNESWGFGGQTELIKMVLPSKDTEKDIIETVKIPNSSAFEWIHQVWNLAKSVDTTRLIEDMSVVVWEHLAAYGHVDTDINSWHFYIDDYHRAKAHIENVVAETYRGSTFNYVEGYTQRNVPLINSEYGGVGAMDGDRDISWSFKFLTNELRRHSQLSAYIFTELTDVEWERNGFLNYDRTPKHFGYPPTLINQGDVLPIDAPPISRQSLGSEVSIEVMSSHFSKHDYDPVTFHWIYSGMDSLGIQHSPLERGTMAIPFTRYRVESAKVLQIRLPEEMMLCTLSVAAVSNRGTTVAANFIQHFAMDGPLAEREDRESMLIFRKRIHEWSSEWWSGGSSSRQDAFNQGACFGRGFGFFEWEINDEAIRHVGKARRMGIVMELSSRIEGRAQTNSDRSPSHVEIHVNDLVVYRGLLSNHPHDSRGSLSYLRGGDGAYGYSIRVLIDNNFLQTVAGVLTEGTMRLKCVVVESCANGLTVYDYDCGRYPFGPTVFIEW